MVIAVLIISIILGGCFAQQPAPKPLIFSPAGVSVEGMPVGGLSMDELRAALTELAKQKNTLPQNAAFDAEGRIVAEKTGRMLNIQATADAVMATLPQSEAEAKYSEISPPISQVKLSKARQLASYKTTILDDNPDRVNNIALTAALLNNTLLEPGQEFSFNHLTGEPTEERGFRKAVILENGQKVQGIGGGMCQVSSTLYNAALEAGLPIVERHPHSQPVSYVPEGRDATTFTNKDLRFRNSTRQELILRVLQRGKTVQADILALPS